MPEKVTPPINLRAQREAVNIYYVYHFPIFVFLIQVTGMIFIAIVYLFIKIYLNDFGYLFFMSTPEQERNFHLLAAPLAFVFLTGEGILIFRICKNIKTYQVKICHIILHSLGAIIGAYGIFTMYDGKEKGLNDKLLQFTVKRTANNSLSGYSTHTAVFKDSPHMRTSHPALGYFSALNVVLEIISGVVLMVMNVNSPYVDMVSELHGFMGVFTLITTSITSIVGLMTKMNDRVYFSITKYYNFSDEYKLAFCAISSCLIFTWGIIYVVINPHFEWVKIGPL